MREPAAKSLPIQRRRRSLPAGAAAPPPAGVRRRRRQQQHGRPRRVHLSVPPPVAHRRRRHCGRAAGQHRRPAAADPGETLSTAGSAGRRLCLWRPLAPNCTPHPIIPAPAAQARPLCGRLGAARRLRRRKRAPGGCGDARAAGGDGRGCRRRPAHSSGCFRGPRPRPARLVRLRGLCSAGADHGAGRAGGGRRAGAWVCGWRARGARGLLLRGLLLLHGSA